MRRKTFTISFPKIMPFNFIRRTFTTKRRGWREFYVAPRIKSDDESDAILPKMKKGDDVIHQKSEFKKSTTKPPVRFTSSTLVQGMKEIHKYVKNPESKKQLKDVYGIGTEATRATIIEDLLKRGFLKTVKKSLYPTDKAYMLIDALPDEMTYPDATAIWEDKLHSMSEGDGTLEEFLSGQAKFTAELCQKAEATNIKIPDGLKKCPSCQKGIMVKRNGKNGEFWSCSDYPDCKTSANDNNGKPDFNAKKKSFGRKNFSGQKNNDMKVVNMAEYVSKNFL